MHVLNFWFSYSALRQWSEDLQPLAGNEENDTGDLLMGVVFMRAISVLEARSVSIALEKGIINCSLEFSVTKYS